MLSCSKDLISVLSKLPAQVCCRDPHFWSLCCNGLKVSVGDGEDDFAVGGGTQDNSSLLTSSAPQGGWNTV